jgi:2-polyprenyl-3-methyl-5-hydroxy-6-metoxy-1,4-benzoquinol methylase
MRERAFHDVVIDELRRWGPQARAALDVGCGSGTLLVSLQRAGWRAEGLEQHPRAVEVAARTSGCRVHAGSIFQADLGEQRFDLVVLKHVFEHVADSRGVLIASGRLLRTGGRLVLIYPNMASLLAKIYRRSWVHWDAPRHLVLPTATAITKLAARSGLRLLRYRARAQSVAELSAISRARRGGIPATAPARGDRFLAKAESLLVAAGVNCGEEVVVSFEVTR